MQKHIQHNKDERTQFFKKYLSLHLKGFEMVTKGFTVWEVSRSLNKTATYWPPNSSGYSSISFPFSWAAQPGAQPLLEHGSRSSIFSPINLNFLSPGLYNNLTSTSFLWASQFTLNSTRRQSRLSPDIFDQMHLLFTQVHFSSDSPAGSEVNMQHYDLIFFSLWRLCVCLSCHLRCFN